ncbi:putative high affinity immunoglobulin gamma Fc receptor IB isoform X3 [Antennarius striatus]|uniref:putative high affinity immunoglobulin gamma Fc receptor IB isoform X3 n=1 Tax=Antennarius striatus TaxID=241820 RepID=UPI0035B46DBC
MNIVFISSLLCVAAFDLQVSTSEETVKVSVLVWPPGSHIYLELPPPSLTLTPSTRQFFKGELFTLQCPVSQSKSSDWMLRQFSLGRTARKRLPYVDQCSPLGGVVSAEKSGACVFTAVSGSSGLYWCEGAKGRSNGVSITVSAGTIIMKIPAFPVLEGEEVVLHCQYSTDNQRNTTFFKNGAEVFTHSSSSSDRMIKMTIENVTQDDEGFYKCASQDRKMESPESWLSVRAAQGDFTPTNGTGAWSGSWKWTVSCILVLLFLIPLTVWLVCRYRYQMICTRSCWPVSRGDQPALELPATKQDTTEVQWDLSWIEMSSLLDKQLCPGT